MCGRKVYTVTLSVMCVVPRSGSRSLQTSSTSFGHVRSSDCLSPASVDCYPVTTSLSHGILRASFGSIIPLTAVPDRRHVRAAVGIGFGSPYPSHTYRKRCGTRNSHIIPIPANRLGAPQTVSIPTSKVSRVV